MKTHRASIRYHIALTSRLFLGIILLLLFPLNVRAEVDYGKETIMVSMGDSYSSGEGITPFYGPKDIAEKVKDEDWLAHRSKLSWPGQLQLNGLDQEMEAYKVDLKNKEKSQDKIGKWYFVASSGAVTDNIFDEKQNKPYDKKKLKKDDNPLPLQAEIFQSIKADEVDYITLTLGGNDVGFSDIVTSCALNVSFSEPNGMPNLLINAWIAFYEGENPIREKLSTVYKKLWEKIGKKGNIIVAGYPQLIDPEGGKILFGLFGYEFDKTDAKVLNRNVSMFNDAIERVVLDTREENEGMNIYFVSVEDVFIDHGAYADKEYINKVKVPSTDEDLKKDRTSASSIHPNKTGASKYAKCVQDMIKWIEAGKPSISVSGQVIDKNDQPAGDLTVVIETEKAKKEVFRGNTDENGNFGGEIKLTKQDLRIVVSNEEKKLIATSIIKPIEYGDNNLGKIKLNNYEGVMIVPIDDSEQDYDEITTLLRVYVEQKEFMYGKSYAYTNFARTEYYPDGGEQWEGISENQLLGYCIEDFDDDNLDELLMVRSEGGYLQLEMYEVENGEVVLVDTKFMESDSRYGAVPLLHAESSTGDVGTRNGVLCCLVQKSSHRIFLQNSDTVWKMGGNEIFIVSTIYKDNQFSDYNVIHTIGTAIELPGTGTDEYDQQLKDLGVPDPDFSSMFYKFEPLINCFDGDARIVLMAEQHLVDEHKENGTTIKVTSETTFEKMESAEEYDGAQTGVKPEAESNSFTYKVYNDFFREGYKSVTEYRPEEWALVELDDDGIPEILFKENSVNRGATFEIYYYNDQSGTVESAGSFYEEYYEAVRYNSQKHLLSTDGSMAGLQSWDGYSYDDHEIDWAFTLSASTDPGSSPRTYTVEGTDETGTNVLGNYEMDGVDRIWDEYFGEQTEITFQTFFTGVNWNLPEGHGEHGE